MDELKAYLIHFNIPKLVINIFIYTKSYSFFFFLINFFIKKSGYY